MNRRSLLTAAAALTASGCYGKFALTGKLLHWNGTLGNKFVNTVVFWALIIIPVYEVVGFIDFVALNLIEFWTGSNPVAEVAHPDGSKTRFARLSPDTVRLTRVVGGVAQAPLDLNLVSGTAAQVRDADGVVWVTNEVLADGSMVVTTPRGRTVVDAALVSELHAQPRVAQRAQPLLSGAAVASR